MITTKPTTNFLELILTCSSWQEAQRIADHLLNRRLIGAIEFFPVTTNLWKTKFENTTTVKLVMESAANYFATIQAEIIKLRGYENVVVQTVPITRLSSKAAAWLEGER